jgi:phospholipid/cholesterol/gamma-HCH transport system ATP-binding protein
LLDRHFYFGFLFDQIIFVILMDSCMNETADNQAGKVKHTGDGKAPIIEFRDVVKSFGSKVILDGISFKVFEGETLCVVGGSGTGKSVTLKLLLGLMPFDSGEIFFKGQPISELDEDKLNEIRVQVGMVFQGSALFDSMNVFDNVAYPLMEQFHLEDEKLEDIILKKLEMVGLKDAAELMPSSLSGGMLKRVGLARAIATDAKVILYDEPTAGLDPTNVNRIDELILKCQSEFKVTSIVVTHHMDSVYRIANRVALLLNKKMIFEGPVADFKTSRDSNVVKFVEGRIGD